MEAGLHNGSIDNEEKNWEYLAHVLPACPEKKRRPSSPAKEASKIYPKAGNLDMLIGQYYYSLDKPEEAYKYLDTSFKKGIEGKSPTQLAQGYVFLLTSASKSRSWMKLSKPLTKRLSLIPIQKTRSASAIPSWIRSKSVKQAKNRKSA